MLTVYCLGFGGRKFGSPQSWFQLRAARRDADAAVGGLSGRETVRMRPAVGNIH